MSDTDLEYAHPDDDLSRAYTATLASGSQATGYEPVRLTNDNPAYPFKASGTKFRLLWDFVTAKTVEYVMLVHHNFQAGLSGVTFAMGTTTATLNFSRSFTIRDYQEDDWPLNEHLDLRDISPSYRYASLELTSDNIVDCALGKFPMLTTVRALSGHLLLESAAELGESHPIVEHRTDVGVSTIYAYGTRLRQLTGEVIQENDDSAALRAWNRAALGRTLPFVLIPHLDVGEEESWLVRFADPTLPRTFIGPELLSRYRLSFEEVPRGLKPTPSAV